jgi:hypothetical protein
MEQTKDERVMEQDEDERVEASRARAAREADY